MTATRPLKELFRVQRRYGRSVNLERDIGVPGSLDGYILSPLGLEAVARICGALTTRRAHKAWTLTGAYGTGKSAFAHFLLSLCGPGNDPLRHQAQQLVRRASGGALGKGQQAPTEGLIRAVATAQREPLQDVVLRALHRGLAPAGSRSDMRAGLHAEVCRLVSRRRSVDGRRIVELATEAAMLNGGLLLVIDELGKALEYAAMSDGEDVFLLQQLAEATSGAERPFGLVALLHQGFGEYGALLPTDRRTEWLKVQGRFEDIVFAEPPEQVLRVVGSAIEAATPEAERLIGRMGAAWARRLRADGVERYVQDALSAEVAAEVLPLHPVAALVLPSLCAKYAQNDRSLFTFLASREPHAFGRFLEQNAAAGHQLPLQRLDDVYDYFAGIAGQSLGFRPQFQRWAEVQAVVSDARSLEAEAIAAVKTIAVLNLIATSGPLRASHALVLAAMTERPDDTAEQRRWEGVLEGLIQRRLVTYRRQLDEYRLWEGSDFDVEGAIRTRLAAGRGSLAAILNRAAPLSPLVIQRHSFRTGTLRVFERRYVQTAEGLAAPTCAHASSDGLLLYWVDRHPLPDPPSTTADGRPVVVVEAADLARLADAAAEFDALEHIARTETHLQTDGVARREVRHRLRAARAVLDRAVRHALMVGTVRCHLGGDAVRLAAPVLQATLSDLCDRTYSKALVLWNEMVNRRDLTSQGAKARRELIEAMIQHADKPRLGLEGDGPEVSMYATVLARTGIHREREGRWSLGAPSDPGIRPVWDAMVAFCEQSVTTPRTVDELFTLLERPPYGVKRGIMPLLLAAVLQTHADSVSVYREGSFVPALGTEHFEVLVKHPSKFAVKHFALDGLRADIFGEIEQIIGAPGAFAPTTRNPSILAVVRRLVRFATGLPQATQRTRYLSPAALGVRHALLSARELDVLLFVDLPSACGIGAIAAEDAKDDGRRAAFRSELRAALAELQSHLDRCRERCVATLASIYGTDVAVGPLREALRRRATGLRQLPVERRLRAVVEAMRSEAPSDSEWLDALLMVIADRPVRSWEDEDADRFEATAADVARRLRAFEAVHAAIGAHAGHEARHLALTGRDGTPREHVAQYSAADLASADRQLRGVLGQLATLSGAERDAALVLLAEALLPEPESAVARSAAPLGREAS